MEPYYVVKEIWIDGNGRERVTLEVNKTVEYEFEVQDENRKNIIHH